MRCTFCGSDKHVVKLCPQTWQGAAARRNMKCSFCWATDHEIEACPKTWKGDYDRQWNLEKIAEHLILDPE